MVEIRCPNCGGIICRAATPPVEGRCSSCHQISLYDGSGDSSRARPMSEDEIRSVKAEFHLKRKRR